MNVTFWVQVLYFPCTFCFEKKVDHVLFSSALHRYQNGFYFICFPPLHLKFHTVCFSVSFLQSDKKKNVDSVLEFEMKPFCTNVPVICQGILWGWHFCSLCCSSSFNPTDHSCAVSQRQKHLCDLVCESDHTK